MHGLVIADTDGSPLRCHYLRDSRAVVKLAIKPSMKNLKEKCMEHLLNSEILQPKIEMG